MHNTHNIARYRPLLALLLLATLNACAAQTTGPSPVAWENVHEGFLIGNFYTGSGPI